MSISVSQIIDSEGRFREEFQDTPAGFTGTREYIVSGAVSIDEALRSDVGGLPARGDAWSNDMDSCHVISRKASWLTPNRDGEAHGRIHVSVEYGPPQFSVFNDNPAPNTPGQTWSEYATGAIAQTQMFGFLPGTNEILNAPIDNGRGERIDIGVIVLKISRAFDARATIPVGQYIGLMRPPKLNDLALTIPSIWGKNNALTFAPGQLLYKNHEIRGQNGLTIVTHELWASESWDTTWVQESEDGEALARNYASIYQRASFEGLW